MLNKTKDRLKIILIYPPIGRLESYNTPTGLLYVATVLKKSGYNVRLVDCSVEPDYKAILEAEVRDANLLGVYAMSLHIRHLVPLLKRLKNIKPDLKIIWGGPHATLFPEQTAKSTLADIVVRGEGEEAMLEIAKGFESGTLNLHRIGGLSFKEDDNVITTMDRSFIDLDSLPFIDWSLLKKEVMESIKKSIIRVQSSRGCPYKCTFCINVVSKNAKMRYRSPKLVLDEIEYVYREYNISRVGFRDEVFISNRKQTKDIAAGLLERNIRISWLANPRVEYLRESYIDDDFLKLLTASGCNKFNVGAESGSQRILDLLKKGITISDTLNCVRRTKKFNIIPVVAFLTGIPTETGEEQRETLRLIRDIIRIQPKAYINGPANFRPYPGGELYAMCIEKYNLKMPESLEEWAATEVLGGAHPPWIKRMYFNQYLWTGTRAALHYDYKYIRGQMKKNALKGFLMIFIGLMAKFRLRYVFYKFPIEFWLQDWYHRRIIKRVPEFS
ncbi:MAG TPA: radical SAM protein [Candidatus Omnitrophota bacterium]|nr:radical SAM protein [Candidatus Omnitrophota bacterium]